MTPYEKIDFVFFDLKDRIQAGGKWGYHTLWHRVQKSPEKGINKTMFDEIIRKLKADDYITETPTDDGQPVYNITFKGLLFDGYGEEQGEAQRENTRLKFLEDRTLLIAERVKTLTVWITVATVIASLYSLLEILDKLFCIYPKR